MMLRMARRLRRRRGFSLIELVVVLVILAIVAGLVVTIVDWMRRSANYAAAANNQGALLNNLQLYRTTFGNGSYPDRFDSLLDSSGAVPSYMESELASTITPGALTAQELLTLQKGGITTVLDHVDTSDPLVIEGNPGNTGVTPRVLDTTGNVAFLNTASSNGVKILQSLYPTGLPAGVRLVLFGVGPGNTANGRTMQSPPFYTAGVDPSLKYNRFIVCMAVYDPRDGRRCQLKAVLDSKGRLALQNLSEYWQSTNPE